MQVLLVDDEPVNLEALDVILASSGCQSVYARTADEALLALLEGDFAAIVLDIKLPGMTGLELARLIKTRRRTQHIPILFLTAHMLDETDVLRGYGTGAVDYLTKPVSAEILRSKIAVFVDLYRKSRELARANDALQREIAERHQMGEALRRANLELETRVQERTAALQEADRRKDEFLAALAHELRNPLAALHTAVEVFRLNADPGSSLQSSQGVMVRQLRRMTRLIDDLLDVSRITRNKLMLQKSTVELGRVIAEAVETALPAIEQRQHTISVRLPEDTIFLEADLVRLSQVFANLLDNAAKYSTPGGSIAISAELSGSRVGVAVEDHGIGIAPELLPQVFDLFMQADSSPDNARGGLGIGLTLVRRLVEMHGGTVTGHSEGPGKGSRFVVWLPTVNAGERVARTSAPRITPATGRPLRVLVVEDNPDGAEMLEAMLGAWGHETRVAGDGAIALETAKAFLPEVVLLDIGLPRMSGHEVATHLRAAPGGEAILLIAITGWGQEVDRKKSELAGIDHHLLKPVDPALLRNLLDGFRPGLPAKVRGGTRQH